MYRCIFENRIFDTCDGEVVYNGMGFRGAYALLKLILVFYTASVMLKTVTPGMIFH